MEVQLEFNWNEYELKRNQKIINNVTPVIGKKILLMDLIDIIEEPQEQYHEWLKRKLKEVKEGNN
jgi:hypothetical protein|tara:strand:+ start:1446 stop:1640 length:195 start_codon:yes stop_codon:yes gene_type:complete